MLFFETLSSHVLLTLKSVLLVFVLGLCTFSNVCAHKKAQISQKHLRYQPNTELSIQTGNQRNIGQLGLFIPIAQNHEALFHISFIGTLDSSSAKEGNFGLGYRKRTPWGLYGFYSFYDLRLSNRHNHFQQWALGTEFLQKHAEIRANLYLPQSTQYLIEQKTTGYVQHISNNTQGTISNHRSHEIGLMGFDLEVGITNPWNGKFKTHIAYFQFGINNQEKKFHGLRTRLTYDITPFLSLEARTSYNTKHELKYSGGMNMHWRLGQSNSYSLLDGLDKKMTILPIRDIDIVTADVTDVTHTILFQEPGWLLVKPNSQLHDIPIQWEKSPHIIPETGDIPMLRIIQHAQETKQVPTGLLETDGHQLHIVLFDHSMIHKMGQQAGLDTQSVNEQCEIAFAPQIPDLAPILSTAAQAFFQGDDVAEVLTTQFIPKAPTDTSSVPNTQSTHSSTHGTKTEIFTPPTSIKAILQKSYLTPKSNEQRTSETTVNATLDTAHSSSLAGQRVQPQGLRQKRRQEDSHQDLIPTILDTMLPLGSKPTLQHTIPICSALKAFNLNVPQDKILGLMQVCADPNRQGETGQLFKNWNATPANLNYQQRIDAFFQSSNIP